VTRRRKHPEDAIQRALAIGSTLKPPSRDHHSRLIGKPVKPVTIAEEMNNDALPF
jgi:hypothetical protein